MSILHLKAKPNARQNALHVAPDGTVTVRLQAPAHNGRANACLLHYLASVFRIPKSSLTLLAGHTAPFKKVELLVVSAAELQAVLTQYQAEKLSD